MTTENSEVLTVNIPKSLGDVLRVGSKKRLMSKADFVRQILLDGLQRDEATSTSVAAEIEARATREAAEDAAAERGAAAEVAS